jgi:phospholipase C
MAANKALRCLPLQLALGLAAVSGAGAPSRIKHVVVLQVLLFALIDCSVHIAPLQIENRAFDHMLGYLKRNNSEIRGLTGDEYNLENPWDANSKKIYVNDLAQ